MGAAYDLFGDGRAKVFGSYGRYYDWTKYELSRAVVRRRHLEGVLPLARRSHAGLNLSLSHMPGRDLWGSPEGYRDRRVPNFDSVDPAIKPMSQDSFNVGARVPAWWGVGG